MKDWPGQKASLNHDWLRNGLLVLLGAVRNVSAGNVEDPTVVERLKCEVEQWQTHRVEALRLIESFERAMSPAVLFSRPPLSSCSTDVQKWLAELAHANWLHRYPIHAWLKAVKEAVDSLDRAFEVMKGCAPSSVESLRSPRCGKALEQLTHSAVTMAEAVGRLPSRITV